MQQGSSIEERIAAHYGGLSAKLRTAADYVAANPVDVATRSLRAVAATSEVSPATFSRLARVLGFDDYEQMREAGRNAVGQRMVPFSERAHALHQQGADRAPGDFLHAQVQNCLTNITYLESETSAERLNAIVGALYQAQRVLLVGAMGSAGIVDYFAYQAQWFARDWTVAGRNGASVAASLSRMEWGDSVLVLTKTPYATQSMQALKMARSLGLTTIVLTDSHTSPALPMADHFMVIPTDSSNFFSSYAATLVVIETIMSMLVARVGPDAETQIREIEDRVRQIGENWSD